MSRGADIAKATADISLLKDDISAVVEAKSMQIKQWIWLTTILMQQ